MTKKPLDLEALFPELSAIEDRTLHAAVQSIWQELWQMSAYERLEDVPVSLKINYPQIRHSQAIVSVALAAAAVWKNVHDTVVNDDYLVAGALLMDVSKLVETEPSPDGPRASQVGKHLPHALYAAHLALAHSVPLSVVHIISCHSPNGGKQPMTIEAQLLDWIDQADISAFGFEIWARKVQHFQP
jgi:hypothetical protein